MANDPYCCTAGSTGSTGWCSYRDSSRMSHARASFQSRMTLSARDLQHFGGFLDAQAAEEAREAAPARSEAMGLAIPCPAEQRCATSWVFYRPVQAFADNVAQPVVVVLGYVMVRGSGSSSEPAAVPDSRCEGDPRNGRIWTARVAAAGATGSR